MSGPRTGVAAACAIGAMIGALSLAAGPVSAVVGRPTPAGGAAAAMSTVGPVSVSVGDLHLVGGAVRTLRDTVRLVNRRSSTGGAGAAYTPAPVNINALTVDTSFHIRGRCADGLAVVIQNDDIDALGASGGHLGYGRSGAGEEPAPGITHSLAVELDTWRNDEPPVPHLSLQTRGVKQNDSGTAYSLASKRIGPVDDGAPHQVTVHYTEGLLSVSYDGEPVLDQPLDLVDLLGLVDATAYVGVTAANGACQSSTVIDAFDVTS
jgi:hypothetical protein